jgi:hypothetical protein
VREQDRSGFEGLEGCAEMIKCDGRWLVSQMAGRVKVQFWKIERINFVEAWARAFDFDFNFD